MSLLNEMLHDLARQKPAKHVTPMLTAASTRNQNKLKKRVLFLCLSLIAFACSLFLFHFKSLKLVAIADERIMEKPKIERESIPVASAPVDLWEISKPVEFSYIEPLNSATSLRVALQQPLALEALNNWTDAPVDLTQAPVNKVYVQPTLEEWHDVQLNKALKAIDDGLDNEAISLLENILARVPNASAVRENLGLLYLTSGDFTRALDVLNEGLKYSPADAALITIKARILLDKGNAAEAISLLSQYKPSINSFPDYYGTLAAALQSDGRILEAGGLYRSLIQIDPDDGRYWLGYAIALEHNNKAHQAIDAYLRASQNPQSDATVRDYAETRLKVLQG